MTTENTKQPDTTAEACDQGRCAVASGSAFCGHKNGPWIRDGNHILSKRVQNSTGVGELIATLPPFDSRKYVGESESDYMKRFNEACVTGDLIAAAPDLLVQLQRLADIVEWAEVLLCNAEPPVHSTPEQWANVLKEWRDKKHDSSPNVKDQPRPENDKTK